MREVLRTIPRVLAIAVLTTAVHAQQVPLDRLSAEKLEVLAPSARVDGVPGQMRFTERSCRSLPSEDLRRRIVDIAVQEWGFFGFTVVDQTNIVDSQPRRRRARRRTSWLSPEESARVADSIAGYWSITSDGSWILSRQNAVWNGSYGVAARWRDPWSAAFISWVMCEGGLGDKSQFRRGIAHHVYIDQAIEASDDDASQAAFAAYDVGEIPVEPGDMLCSARRSAYRTIAERQQELGNGIRSHCDIVVKVDEVNDRILVIGGNVRGAVRLKLLPAVFEQNQGAESSLRAAGRGGRTVFAHLKLRADSIERQALETSPTIRALGEQGDALGWLEQRLEGESPSRAQAVSTSVPAGGSSASPAAL